MYHFTEYQRCKCGAITLYTVDGLAFSCKEKNFNRFFHSVDLTKLGQLQNSYCCNHCVNHYGLDLCACGSGESYEECENGYGCCGIPMQSLEDGYVRIQANDAWL